MILYSTNMIDEFKNKKMKGLKLILYPLFLVVPLLVLFIMLVNLKTKLLFTILSFIVLFIYSVIVTYNLLENIIKSNDLIKHINLVLNGSTLDVTSSITNISNEITLKRNIHIVEVEVNIDNFIHKVYFNTSLFNQEFKVGDKASLTLSHNFIIQYEVLGNE